MTFVISPEKLGDLLRALETGGEVTPELRRDLIEALYDLSLYQAIEAKSRQRGTPWSDTWIAASVVAALVEAYSGVKGVTVKAATRAVRPDATWQEHQAIERNYRKLLNGGGPPGILADANMVREAEERLDPYGHLFLRRHQKSGNN